METQIISIFNMGIITAYTCLNLKSVIQLSGSILRSFVHEDDRLSDLQSYLKTFFFRWSVFNSIVLLLFYKALKNARTFKFTHCALINAIPMTKKEQRIYFFFKKKENNLIITNVWIIVLNSNFNHPFECLIRIWSAYDLLITFQCAKFTESNCLDFSYPPSRCSMLFHKFALRGIPNRNPNN